MALFDGAKVRRLFGLRKVYVTFVRENSPFVDAGQKKQIWGYLDKKREIQENTYHLPLTR